MNCSKCGQPMELCSQGKSNDGKPERKYYDRFLYHCQADDIWIQEEKPQKNEKLQQTETVA